MKPSLLHQELSVALQLAKEAGTAILGFRNHNDTISTVLKEGDHPSQGDSPVTAADYKSNEILVNGLQHHFPSHALLSEELLEEHTAKEWWKADNVWFIDPLGGTRNFLAGSSDFGVYLGFSQKGVPVLGIYHFPAKDLTYWAVKGEGVYRQSGSNPTEKIIRNHSASDSLQPLRLGDLPFPKTIYDAIFETELSSEEHNRRIAHTGCFGQTLCSIAEGPYNLFMFDGKRGGLWDLIPGEVILNEMGCSVTDWKGNPIDYRRPDASLRYGVIASSGEPHHSKGVNILKNYCN